MNQMNRQRAFGLFPNSQQAEQSLKQLKAEDFPMDHVSLIAKQADEVEPVGEVEMSDRVGNQDVNSPIGTVKEAIATSSAAFVLAGLTSLALPGIGPVLAAGSLGASLVAAVAGEGVGALASRNLVKQLTQLGVPNAQASVYSDRLIQGDCLVIIEGTNNEVSQAENVLNQQGIKNWGVYAAA